jgi:hypothetical protein
MNNFENKEGITEMSLANTVGTQSDLTTQQWLEIRKKLGAQIDPETAEVLWTYGQIMDPYGVEPDLPAEYYQVGRLYFARCPGSRIWVSFYDLPDETRERLWEVHRGSLAFPAGLDGML